MADNTASVVTVVSEERASESSVFDHFERVMHARGGHFAVMINRLNLSAHHRGPHHICIAFRTFNTLLNTCDVQLSALKNIHLFIIYKSVSQNGVETSILKEQFLPSDDPLFDAGGGETLSKSNAFRTCSDMKRYYAAIQQLVRGMVHAVQESVSSINVEEGAKAEPSARDFTKERGYRICLDGLTHDTMCVVDRERLGADKIKPIWCRDLPMDVGAKIARRLVRAVIASKVIFCRCDDDAAAVFVQEIGV